MMWIYWGLLVIGGICLLITTFLHIWNEMWEPWFIKLTFAPIFTVAMFVVPFGIYALCITGLFKLLGWLP